MKGLYSILLCSILLSCSSSSEISMEAEEIPDDSTAGISTYFPPTGSTNWDAISTEELRWNTEALEDLDTFLEATETKAFIILKNGKIAKESYYNGSVSSDNLPWNSAGKTLTAFTTLQAQQDGYLNITDSTTDYLGLGWTAMSQTQERAITFRHQLTMTSGGDYNVNNINCTDPECLEFLNTAGTEWYYHNAFYTLLQPTLDEAILNGFDEYFNSALKERIGMNGAWIDIGYIRVYFSTARSMARFGLLNLRKGTWDEDILLPSLKVNEMTTSSQIMNKAYGYLWWLNGKESYRLPGSIQEFSGSLIPNAPDDLIAGLGANDKKLYVIPSENLVIVRLGDDAGMGLLGPSGYDNMLWEKINAVLNRN